jgi:hypothetical protein
LDVPKTAQLNAPSVVLLVANPIAVLEKLELRVPPLRISKIASYPDGLRFVAGYIRIGLSILTKLEVSAGVLEIVTFVNCASL